MIIPTRLLRAALVCVAKNDARYYLEGVHITSKYIEATNGHVAVRMEHGIKTRRNIIVKFCGNVPAKAETTELVFKRDPIAVHRDINNMRVGFTALELLDGRFPDLGRIIPQSTETGAIPIIQGAILSYPEKMFKSSGRTFIPVKLAPSGLESACRFLFDNHINSTYGNPQFIAMPCRANAMDVVKEILG